MLPAQPLELPRMRTHASSRGAFDGRIGAMGHGKTSVFSDLELGQTTWRSPMWQLEAGASSCR